MRAKIILTLGSFMIVGSALLANFNIEGSPLPSAGNPASVKQLNSKKDFDQMVEDLQQGVKLGDINSMFFLGFIYFDEIVLKDGTKTQPNKQKATEFLFRAIALGSKESVAFLVAKSIETNDVTNMTNAVKAAQNSTISIDEKDYFSMILAGYILDYDVSDAHAIETATKWIYEAEKKRPTPRMQLVLAFMYQKLNNTEAANFYLNKSCSNAEMKEICEQINKEGKDEKSCGKL